MSRHEHKYHSGQDKVPNKESAKKRVRQNERKNQRNRAAKSEMRTMVKATLTEAQVTAAVPTEKLQGTQSLISRLCKRGVIHKKKAARIQSSLTRNVNKVAKKEE